MTQQHPHHKDRLSAKLIHWIDCHPRTGWYLGVWASLLTLNAFIGIVDAILRLIG